MDTAPIIERLRARLAAAQSGVRLVGGAADLGAAEATAPVTPSVFVMPLSDRASEPEMIGLHLQRVEQTFSTILVIANRRDARGGAAVDELEALRAQVRTALLGWVPVPAEGEGVAYAGGRLLKFADQRIWWGDEWSVTTRWTGA